MDDLEDAKVLLEALPEYKEVRQDIETVLPEIADAIKNGSCEAA